jgi:uncharacterized protein YbjT (DUF2867 family)
MATALIVGSTGLIGNQLVELLLNDDRYTQVTAIARTSLPFSHPKLKLVVADFESIESQKEKLVADDIFCCLGTTIKSARSKEAFRKIDFDYPLLIAKLAKAQGAKQYLLVSALGANKASSVFYNKVKGEIEQAISSIGFESYHVFRPSLLLGPRIEKREGERSMQKIFSAVGFLIPKKYKAIESIKVARCMLSFAKKDLRGNFIHESDELQGM